MKEYSILSVTNEQVKINENTLNDFKSGLRGEVILPGDNNYESERKIWNGMIDKKPGMIVLCKGNSDVIYSVKFARRHNLLISVRGGGHNVAGNAVCNGGMMISLIYMKGIIVNPSEKTVIAQPGVSWGEFDKETQAFGLAAPGGIVSTTGISGFTLGGGFGWLTRKYGFASDNLISADIITADGKFLTVNNSENQDLFWGIRGGGGNFGIVTSFKFKLHNVGPNVTAGLAAYKASDAQSVIKFYKEFVENSPDELSAGLILRLAPPAPFLPQEIHGKPIVGIGICYSGNPEEGLKLAEPLKKFGNPIADTISIKPYILHQAMFDAGQLPGNHYYWKSEYLKELSDGLTNTVLEHLEKITSPLSMFQFLKLNTNQSISETDSAVSHRSANFIVNINAGWQNPDESQKHIKWARDTWNAVRPYSMGGVYVNFLSEDEGDDRVRSAYGINYEKLVSLKNKYDPTNFFRLNQNIKPDLTVNLAS
jgi:FAD/FMN-containing dehydrogenase